MPENSAHSGCVCVCVCVCILFHRCLQHLASPQQQGKSTRTDYYVWAARPKFQGLLFKWILNIHRRSSDPTLKHRPSLQLFPGPAWIPYNTLLPKQPLCHGMCHIVRNKWPTISHYNQNFLQTLFTVSRSYSRVTVLITLTQSAGILSCNRKVTGSIPGQDTCLGCRFHLQCKRQPIDVPLSLPFLLSENKIKTLKKEKKWVTVFEYPRKGVRTGCPGIGNVVTKIKGGLQRAGSFSTGWAGTSSYLSL